VTRLCGHISPGLRGVRYLCGDGTETRGDLVLVPSETQGPMCGDRHVDSGVDTMVVTREQRRSLDQKRAPQASVMLSDAYYLDSGTAKDPGNPSES
jgi:hypothetical protein